MHTWNGLWSVGGLEGGAEEGSGTPAALFGDVLYDGGKEGN